MAISRAQLLKELLPGLNALFGMEYKRYENQHTEIYDNETSERSFEEEVKLSGFGQAPVKSEGMAITYDNAREAYVSRYTHETIAMGFSLTEEAVEDNLYDSLSARYTKALARAMAYTKQVKAAAVVNNGFSATGGDGVALFSASHPLTGGGTNSNLGTAADLSETTLEAAVIQINQWTDERGLLIVAKPVKLIIPPQLQFVATRLLQTEQRPGTADNDLNALKSNGIFPQGYVVNNYLTDTNAYFIKTDIPNGMKHFVRVPMKTGMDSDFDTGNARYKARERYSFGYSDHLGMWGSAGA
jgi:phage major head subunit gpT-like protein